MQNPHLRWSPACAIAAVSPEPGCEFYVIQISDSPDFAQLAVNTSVPAILTRLVVLEPLPHGMYYAYWRVATSSGTLSQPSTYFPCRAPGVDDSGALDSVICISSSAAVDPRSV
jgi:hypothetical protein